MIRRPRIRRTLDVLVVGAGQAGLAIGRELERAGDDFLILDGARAVGESWRTRWDSLRLFTPASLSALPGIALPGSPHAFPGKDAVADYLAHYARAFSLPIGLDEPVRALERDQEGRFIATTDHARYRALSVVVATGPFQSPVIPAMAQSLSPSICQLHSSAYRNPRELPPGRVVVVGGGSSGVQIAADLASTHDVTLAVGARYPRLPERVLGRSVFRWLDAAGAFSLPGDTWLGRRWRRRDILIGEGPDDVARRLGVQLAGRVAGADSRGLVTGDGRHLAADAVVWATGFRSRYDWLRLPVLDARGAPQHARGVTAVPGLYFLGLPWLHARGSALLGWVARDAHFLGERIARHLHAA